MKGILTSDTKMVRRFLKKHHFSVSSSKDRYITYKSTELTELVVMTGAAGQRAYGGARMLGGMSEVTFIASVGTAAALVKTVRIGSVMLCERLRKLEGDMALWSPSSVGELKIAKLEPMEMLFRHIDESERKLFTGSMVTAPHIATNSNMRAWLGRRLGVDAMDQDASYIALACSEMSIPFAIIRGITSQESSNFSLSRYRAGSSTRSAKSKRVITPVGIFDYIKFHLGVRTASNRMDQVLTRINALSLHE